MTAELHVSRPADGVALIEIDAPPANALGTAIRRRMLAELDAIERDTDVRVLVLTGRGNAFCSGDDLKEAAERGEGALESLDQFAALYEAIETLRVPVIAAVNGWCMGGGLELALACDIRLASSAASFTCSGVNVGLIASAYRLPRLIGPAHANTMLLTGLPFDAVSAVNFGLVAAAHSPEGLQEAALTLAGRIASRAPLSVEATKRIVSLALDTEPDDALSIVAEELATLAESEDHRNALAAFAEKRQPVFRRR
jgi:enoyl-CoA hydratase